MRCGCKSDCLACCDWETEEDKTSLASVVELSEEENVKERSIEGEGFTHISSVRMRSKEGQILGFCSPRKTNFSFCSRLCV